MSTSLIEAKVDYIEKNKKLEILFNSYLKGNKDNEKLMNLWKKFYEIFRGYNSKQPKENKTGLQKFYNKFIKGKNFEVTTASKSGLKKSINSKGEVDMKILLCFKKEIDVYMFLLVRSFIFENISVGNIFLFFI